MEKNPTSPVSFSVNVARLPSKGMPVTIEADDEQRAALAAEHGLVSVRTFRAALLVAPWKGDGVRITGEIEADIVQQCVVTLDPLDARIAEPVEAVFLPRESKLARGDSGGEIVLDADGPDAPETFAGDTIDVGALAEELFAVAIDPYPRKEGVGIVAVGEDDAENYGPLREKLRLLQGKP